MLQREATNTNTFQPDLGMADENRQAIVNTLRRVLADEEIIYHRLRNYHWNVTGPQFHALHEMYEEQYEALEEAIDDVAERVRTYGATAPGTLREFIDLTRFDEFPGEYPDAHRMTAHIAEDHEAMVRHLRSDIDFVGDEHHDKGAEDFLIGLMQQHQEFSWMLRAFLQGHQV